MKFSKLTKIFCIFLVVVIFSLPFSYAIWGGLEGDDAIRDYSINTGNFWADDVEDNPLDRLPASTPTELESQLNDILQSQDLTDDEFCGFVDTVISILNYIGKQGLNSDVLVGSDIDDLFDRNNHVASNDFLVFVSHENGVSEIIVVHVDANSNFHIDSAESLFYALERAWTGVNVASTVWLSGNLYTTYHSPVEYDGRLFLMNFDGPSGTPPTEDSNTWFELTANFEYTARNNRYNMGYITRVGERHFVSSQQVWGVSPTAGGWNPWTEIFAWQSGTNFVEGTMVKTGSGSDVRFWVALQASTNSQPNEQNARLGIWREVNNGWIGKNGDTEIKSHYFEHNTYTAGTVVIYGISPRMNFRYFEAIGDVPADCPPLYLDQDNNLQVNSQYWNIY